MISLDWALWANIVTVVVGIWAFLIFFLTFLEQLLSKFLESRFGQDDDYISSMKTHAGSRWIVHQSIKEIFLPKRDWLLYLICSFITTFRVCLRGIRSFLMFWK